MGNPCYHLWAIGTLMVCLAAISGAKAQTQQIQYGVESSVYTSTDENLPFWFYSNKGGVVDPSSTNFINHFYSSFSREDTTRSLKFSAGIDIHTRLSNNNTLLISQLYGDAQYRGLHFTAGRFYDPMGLNEHDLSMGSMLVSHNAVPLPKVRLATDGFMPLPGTNDHLLVSGMIAHGWFTEERYIDNPYLHQKYLYLKYKRNRFDLTVGAAHNAVWGGTHPGFSDDGSGAFKLPSSFSDYVKVVFGQSASGNAPANDTSNVIGNTVAAYEVKAGVNFDGFRLKAYRLFYLEDKIAMRFRSPWDGTWGAGIELDDPNGFVTEVLWEHMNTKRQNAWIDMPWGRTNYYNNGVYRAGWTYEGRVLGNPLIINGPVANFESGQGYPIYNNIIIAHHVGVKGAPSERLSYKAMLTYSRNYGTHYDQGEESPYEPLDNLRHDEFSSLLQVDYLIVPKYGLSLQSTLAFDVGDLYDNNRWGFQFGIRWNKVEKFP